MKSFWILVSVLPLGFGLHGILDKDLSRYSNSKPFKCITGDTHFAPVVNDDFCDCADGSDEPGTSACTPHGRFVCKNAGFRPASILSSRVRDGICDVECCDGSDELDLKTGASPCPDICEQVAKVEYQKEMEAKAILEVGAKQKREYMNRANELKQKREQESQQILIDIQNLEKKRSVLAAQEIEEEKLEREDLSKTCGPLVERFDSWLRTFSNSLNSLKNATYKSLESLDVFFERSAASYSQAADQQDDPTDSENGDTLAEEKAILDAVDEDTLADGEGIPNIPSDLYTNKDAPARETKKDACRPFKDKLISWSKKLLDSTEAEATVPSEALSGREPSKTKQELNMIDSDLSSKRITLSDLEKKSKFDFGPNGVFEALYHSCFSIDTNEYVYEMCFFGSATQKSGGQQTSLGEWTRWSGPPDNLYSEMMFEQGTPCWNGPARSLKVSLTCGSSELVTSVSEPSKCEYIMMMQSPALCNESLESKKTQAILHDEL